MAWPGGFLGLAEYRSLDKAHLRLKDDNPRIVVEGHPRSVMDVGIATQLSSERLEHIATTDMNSESIMKLEARIASLAQATSTAASEIEHKVAELDAQRNELRRLHTEVDTLRSAVTARDNIIASLRMDVARVSAIAESEESRASQLAAAAAVRDSDILTLRGEINGARRDASNAVTAQLAEQKAASEAVRRAQSAQETADTASATINEQQEIISRLQRTLELAATHLAQSRDRCADLQMTVRESQLVNATLAAEVASTAHRADAAEIRAADAETRATSIEKRMLTLRDRLGQVRAIATLDDDADSSQRSVGATDWTP